MLPISELVRVDRSIDEEGSSPLALRAARAWGYERIRFVRSSANHVFLCEAPDGDRGLLRLSPRSRERNELVAQTASRLAAAGAAVAPAVESLNGGLAVVVAAGSRRYTATVFAAIPGDQIGAESLSEDAARSWGRALARFHEAATRLDPAPAVPRWFDVVAAAAESVEAEGVLEDLRRLPVQDERVGLVHGDPELDNVLWDPSGRPTFVDLDDLSWSWFAADICFALRDFGRLDPFIDGYRECRPLTDEEVSWLPLFRRAHDAVTLGSLERIAEPDAEDWPLWAKELNARLREVAARLRDGLASA